MVAKVEKVSRKSVSSRVEWMKGWASWVIFQGTSVSITKAVLMECNITGLWKEEKVFAKTWVRVLYIQSGKTQCEQGRRYRVWSNAQIIQMFAKLLKEWEWLTLLVLLSCGIQVWGTNRSGWDAREDECG